MSTQSSGAFTDLGKREDLYYTDPDNCKVESIPVEYNTRYSQDFSNKSSGTSVFIIPPGNGLKHVLIVLGYNASTINGQNGTLALEQGWGYSAISQVSFRIGGSSQYFLTGQQILAMNLRKVRSQTQAQALLQLGGSECKVATDFDVNQYAYIPVPIWCMPSNDGLSVPLPADTLAQQVQITCTLNAPGQFWISNGVVAANAAPLAFDVAQFQVEQLCMVDRGMAISNHVDLNTHELLMPTPFDQQELQIRVPAGSLTSPAQLVATGFRAGQVKSIQMWLTKDSDALNPLLFYAPAAVTVLYSGTIYSQYNNGSSVIWNLLDGTKPPAVTQSKLAATAVTGVFTSTPVTSQYCMLPFGNPSGSDYEAEVLSHGKPILSGLVNLIVTAPTDDAYTAHVSYIYNSTLVFSKSSAEYRF
jgi:hypothetical protein